MKQENKAILLLYITIAYLFSIAVRMIWVYQFSGYDSALWNGELMISTNDGYYFAEGARDILAGFHQANDLSPTNEPISYLTALFATILPFSFETIILYMPAFLGSLLVIPIILIGRALNQTFMGFIAGVLGGIVWSYYNRTMTGYYDTDMLTIVLPTFVLWSMILALRTNQDRYLIITTLSVILYSWWYAGSYSLNFAFIAMTLVYSFFFHKKEIYPYKLIIFLIIAMLPLVVYIKLPLALALYYLFLKTTYLDSKQNIYILLGAAFTLLLVLGGLSPILYQLKGYILREAVVNEGSSLEFYSVLKTVREAGTIPFEIFANRISGAIFIFLFSIVGYILLLKRYKSMLLSLPMVGLGFLAYGIPGLIDGAGLRFTVYAVPPMALGFGYAVLLLSEQLAKLFREKVALYATYAFALLFLAIALYPNIIHVIGYKVPTVFSKDEVRTLDKLKEIASREDYVVTWWDYGYPLRFYSDVKTLVDGGKHTGDVNFPASFALTSPSHIASANMARLAVEYTESAYEQNRTGNYISMMMEDYNYTDPNQLLADIHKDDFPLPAKTRDIFFYLPERMINIYTTVKLFSVNNLKTGEPLSNPFFHYTSNFKQEGALLHLGGGITLDGKSGNITINGQTLPINEFITVGYDQTGKLHKSSQKVNSGSPLYVVYLRTYQKFLVMDTETYNSAYVQMYLFENYDKNLFELVITSPWVKIYKLKR